MMSCRLGKGAVGGMELKGGCWMVNSERER